MHCCARNIARLIRILKLRTDLRSRFVACSFPLKSEINELPPAPPQGPSSGTRRAQGATESGRFVNGHVMEGPEKSLSVKLSVK